MVDDLIMYDVNRIRFHHLSCEQVMLVKSFVCISVNKSIFLLKSHILILEDIIEVREWDDTARKFLYST